jgi:glycerate kinase
VSIEYQGHSKQQQTAGFHPVNRANGGPFRINEYMQRIKNKDGESKKTSPRGGAAGGQDIEEYVLTGANIDDDMVKNQDEFSSKQIITL